MLEKNARLHGKAASKVWKCKLKAAQISCLFRAFLYFYRKKVAKSDRLNVFIVTFATLIINDRNKRL